MFCLGLLFWVRFCFRIVSFPSLHTKAMEIFIPLIPVTPYRQILSKTHFSLYLPQSYQRFPLLHFSHRSYQILTFPASHLHRTFPSSILLHRPQIILSILLFSAVTDPSQALHPFLSPVNRIKYIHFCFPASSLSKIYISPILPSAELSKFYLSHSCLGSYQRSISLSLSQIPSTLHTLLVCVWVFCLVALFGLLPPRVRSFNIF